MISAASHPLPLNGNRHQICIQTKNSVSMKLIVRISFLSAFLLGSFLVSAQPVKVAVFAPLHLDEAFNGSSYKLGKSSIPKNILTGLEFYNGVMLAIDSLEREGASVEVHIYDTKQEFKNLASILMSAELNNTGLIIGSVTNQSELITLSTFALQKNIPFISATYPNTGNITGNPYFVMLNSSLQAHVEGIYKYVQRNFPLENIIMVSKNGTVENYLKNTFNNLNSKTRSSKLNWTLVQLSDTFSNQHITRYIDTMKNNIVLVSSPLETFGVKVVSAINAYKNSNATIIGMPTWDGIRVLNNATFKNVDIVYSTPFDFTRYNRVGSDISRRYRAKFNSRPSDMVYRGYETFFHFTKLLLKHRKDLVNKIADKDYTIFNEYDIQPVKLKSGAKPDYYENKKLYFITKHEGEIQSVTTNAPSP